MDELMAQLSADIANAGTPRFLLGIAGPPGSGKTTLAQRVADHLNSAPASFKPEAEPQAAPLAAVVPMDGFHLANATLARLGRHDRKGAPDTFDAWGFLALLQRIRNELDHPVYLPSFRREVDEPIAAELVIEPGTQIVVVEGNYLFLDAEPWVQLRDLFHLRWYVDTPDEVREERLVARHTRHGRTPDQALEWARRVDGGNAALIEPTRVHADRIVSGTQL